MMDWDDGGLPGYDGLDSNGLYRIDRYILELAIEDESDAIIVDGEGE